MEKLERQIAFIRELDRLKTVLRRALIKCDDNRRENAAEHTWHIMMMAHVLKEYAEQTIDINRVTALLLVHDIVEIDAGDTFAFASEHELNGQRDREVKALGRIMGILPPEQHEEFKALWLEFDEGKTPDAMYAIAIDRLSPLLQNVVNDGGSWARHSISRTQLIDRNQYLRESAPKLWNYALLQIEIAVDKGWIKSSQD